LWYKSPPTPSLNPLNETKNMKLSKLIFYISIFLILFWILAAMLSACLPIECTHKGLVEVYTVTRFYGFPVAILFALCGTVRATDSPLEIGLKVIGTVIVSGISVFVLFLALFGGMCAWSSGTTLFIHKNDPATKIVLRDYGCGATDSSPPKYALFKERKLIDYFYWEAEFDTLSMDKREWVRQGE
jgi:hypothetical protein